MSPRTLLDHFDLLAEAPGGVARLRELVLHLAVRGKLVAQDPADEPASELLKRIASERARLVKEGKIRAGKPLPPVGADEAPFEVPEGWVWCRLGTLTHDLGQGVPQERFTYIDVGSIDNLRGAISADLNIIEPQDAPSRARKAIAKGCVIYSTVRPYLLNVAIVEHDFTPPAIASTAFAVLDPFPGVSNRFLYRLLRSPFFVDYVADQMKGVAYPAINDSNLLQAPVPLPPLAEQHRIVARVDELMALLDRLEAARGERDTTRLAARDSALATLRDAADADEVAAAWHRLEARMEDLFRTPEDVPPLRQAILQLAVRGRLVAQDPADEPASELLDAGLVPSGARSGVPWPAPQNWAWSSLRNLGTFVGGGTPSKNNPSLWNGNIPWVSPKDMKTALITDSQDHIAEQALSESAVKLIPVGSVLMVVRGMILAHSFPTARTAVPVTINQDMKAIVPRKKAITDYLHLLLQASGPRVLGLVERSTHGTCKLPFDLLVDLPLPLPPLPEQHRIVARVDQLNALCDRLESRLAAARDAQTALAAALLHQVTQPDFAA